MLEIQFSSRIFLGGARSWILSLAPKKGRKKRKPQQETTVHPPKWTSTRSYRKHTTVKIHTWSREAGTVATKCHFVVKI